MPETIIQTETVLRQAGDCLRGGNPEETLSLLDALDDESEQGGLICYLRGSAYLRMEQDRLADEYFSRAINQGFVSYKLYVNLAAATLRLGKPVEAELMYRQAAELDSSQLFPLNMIVQLRLEAGNFEGAMAAATELQTLHPAHFDGFHHRADLLLGTGKIDEALSLLDEIAERFSAHPLYVYDRCRALSRLGRHSEALDCLEGRMPVFATQGMSVLYVRECSRLLMALGDTEGAMPLLRALFEGLGDRQAGYTLMITVLGRENFEEAASLARRLTEGAARDHIYYMSLYMAGMIRKLQSGPEAARPDFERALQEFETAGNALGVDLRIVRANLYAETGRSQEAVGELDILSGLLRETGVLPDEEGSAGNPEGALGQLAALRERFAAVSPVQTPVAALPESSAEDSREAFV